MTFSGACKILANSWVSQRIHVFALRTFCAIQLHALWLCLFCALARHSKPQASRSGPTRSASHSAGRRGPLLFFPESARLFCSLPPLYPWQMLSPHSPTGEGTLGEAAGLGALLLSHTIRNGWGELSQRACPSFADALIKSPDRKRLCLPRSGRTVRKSPSPLADTRPS